MLDLFCGRGGWTNAFLERGWKCIGVDLVRQPEYRGEFWQRDVLTFNAVTLRELWDFICISSPCEDFSKTCKGGMACFYPNAPYPAKAIRLFNHAREICEFSGIPYIMENVRGAEQWVGNAKHHAGPFYLWGNAVPPLLPKGITKGTTNMLNWNKNKTLGPQKSAALLATIPPELANCVADYAERLLEVSRLSAVDEAGREADPTVSKLAGTE